MNSDTLEGDPVSIRARTMAIRSASNFRTGSEVTIKNGSAPEAVSALAAISRPVSLARPRCPITVQPFDGQIAHAPVAGGTVGDAPALPLLNGVTYENTTDIPVGFDLTDRILWLCVSNGNGKGATRSLSTAGPNAVQGSGGAPEKN